MSLSTRLAGAIVILVLVTVAAVGFLTYRAVEATVLPGELDRVDAHARALSTELRAYARGARADITAFRSDVALQGLIRAAVAGGVDPSTGRTEAQWRDGAAKGQAARGQQPEAARVIVDIERTAAEHVAADEQVDRGRAAAAERG